ncbi:MAG: sialate O-acetylesterase, partial [Bacteroidia bacterium]
IYFTNADEGLKSKDNIINGFYIAGDDKIFMPAAAKIAGNTVEVWNDNIKNPVAVRFDFTNSSIAELFSKEGLPVNLFRTDNWDDVNTINSQ